MSEKEKTKLTIVRDDVEEIKEVNKPTPEEVLQFRNEFEKAMEEFKNTKWEISEKGNFAANDMGLFIIDFMNNFAFWTKTGWIGILKMNEELRKALALVDENSGLQFDYQALEFCAFMLANPGGIGYNKALEFEKIAEKYSKIGILLGTKVEEARTQLKGVQYLQEKWAAAEQGFYLSELEPKDASTGETPKESKEKIIQMKINPKEKTTEIINTEENHDR